MGAEPLPAGLLAVSASNSSGDSGPSHSCHHLALALGTFLSASFSLTKLCHQLSVPPCQGYLQEKEWLGRAHLHISDIPCSSSGSGASPASSSCSSSHEIHAHTPTQNDKQIPLIPINPRGRGVTYLEGCWPVSELEPERNKVVSKCCPNFSAF